MTPLIRQRIAPARSSPLPHGLNRRLTMELDRGRLRELVLVVGLAAAMLLPLLAYVWQNVEWIESGYALERLKTRKDRLIEANNQLRLERSSLESLARVQRLADERLGLAEPPGGTVVLVAPPDPKAGRTPTNGRLASVRADHDGTKTKGTPDDDATSNITR